MHTISCSEIAATITRRYGVTGRDGRRQSVFLWGPPGTGKSAAVDAACAALDLPVWTHTASIMDITDGKGIPIPDLAAGLTRFLPPADLLHDTPGILFLDELCQAPASVMATLSRIIYSGRIGDHALDPGIMIVAASNRQSDRAGVNRLPTQLANRFSHYSAEPDWQGFCDRIGPDIGISPWITAYLRYAPDDLYRFDPASAELAWPSLRSWEAVSDTLAANLDPVDQAADIAATIGAGVAAKFCGFLRLAADLPDLDQAIAHPATCPIPTTLDAQYASLAGLHGRLDPDTWAPILQYVERYSVPAFSETLAAEALRRRPELAQSSAFATWACAHADIIRGF